MVASQSNDVVATG